MKELVLRAAGRLRASRFARDAAVLLGLSVVSRALGFLGNAYAAKCLGPTYLGISAVVQTTVSQVGLAYNGGFDTVAVRRIAADPRRGISLVGGIVLFRLVIAIIVSGVWLAVTSRLADHAHRLAWMLGIPILMFSAVGVVFVFQGLERLPIQNAINAGGVVLS